jgi:hypothetical protein
MPPPQGGGTEAVFLQRGRVEMPRCGRSPHAPATCFRDVRGPRRDKRWQTRCLAIADRMPTVDHAVRRCCAGTSRGQWGWLRSRWRVRTRQMRSRGDLRSPGGDARQMPDNRSAVPVSLATVQTISPPRPNVTWRRAPSGPGSLHPGARIGEMHLAGAVKQSGGLNSSDAASQGWAADPPGAALTRIHPRWSH